jgi:hypothetical protein
LQALFFFVFDLRQMAEGRVSSLDPHSAEA